MTTRNKRKLAALNKENCEEHPRSNLAQNSSAPRSQEEYITQISEEIEGRVTKRLSKEFSRTENRILGALARLDDFLMNPLLPGYSGTTPEATRSALGNNQGTNEDDSQNDPHPEAGLFHGHTTRNVGPEEGHDNFISGRHNGKQIVRKFWVTMNTSFLSIEKHGAAQNKFIVLSIICEVCSKDLFPTIMCAKLKQSQQFPSRTKNGKSTLGHCRCFDSTGKPGTIR